jgi:hypothetical protein
MRLDPVMKIGLVLNNAGDDQAPPAPASDLDGEMDSLARMDAAERDQAFAGAPPDWVKREVDAL